MGSRSHHGRPSSIRASGRLMFGCSPDSGSHVSEIVRVTVWGENVHERNEPEVRALYPEGLHGAIAAGLSELLGDRVRVRTATLREPEHGLTQEVIDDTDVLTWWGHI